MSPEPFNADAACVRDACQQSDMHRALALCRILYICNEDLLIFLRMHMVWILLPFIVSLCRAILPEAYAW